MDVGGGGTHCDGDTEEVSLEVGVGWGDSQGEGGSHQMTERDWSRHSQVHSSSGTYLSWCLYQVNLGKLISYFVQEGLLCWLVLRLNDGGHEALWAQPAWHNSYAAVHQVTDSSLSLENVTWLLLLLS